MKKVWQWIWDHRYDALTLGLGYCWGAGNISGWLAGK